jgi:hypothetical protein
MATELLGGAPSTCPTSVQSVLAASEGPEQPELVRASTPTKTTPTLRPIALGMAPV